MKNTIKKTCVDIWNKIIKENDFKEPESELYKESYSKNDIRNIIKNEFNEIIKTSKDDNFLLLDHEIDNSIDNIIYCYDENFDSFKNYKIAELKDEIQKMYDKKLISEKIRYKLCGLIIDSF